MHSHIWDEQLPVLPEYVAAVRAAGVTKSVVLVLEDWRREVEPGMTWRGAGNDYVASCVEAYPEHLLLFGTVPPDGDDAADRLEDLVKKYPDMKGLKLHPAIQGFNPAAAPVIRFVRKAAQLGLTMVFHTGDVGWVGRLANNHPYFVDELAAAVPEAHLIFAHGAATQLIPWVVARHPNVRMDTAYAPNWPSLPPFHWRFQCIDADLVDFLGADKIVYGTDLNPQVMAHPTQLRDGDDQDPGIEGITLLGLEVIEKLEISEADKQQILEGNAREILGL
jgi:predicted TIM-barrel fold metal-dependent hydrolase